MITFFRGRLGVLLCTTCTGAIVRCHAPKIAQFKRKRALTVRGSLVAASLTEAA